MQLDHLAKITGSFDATETMPLLFIGHGNPMNAIEQNEFSKGWGEAGKTLPKPNAILCISAHWETKGTFITAMDKPKTIHDFGGFPQELFDVQYPAPGNPALAKETKELLTHTEAKLDEHWGLDHGCWSVVKNMYPDADIPVIQLSMDYTKTPQWHYELAKQLSSLRNKGVLIIGSGNMVHNLRNINWHAPDKGYDWADEANLKLKDLIIKNEHQQLMGYHSLGTEMTLAIPTPEHYMPLLYILGLKKESEQVNFFNDKTIMGSISMTSLKIN
ncbi:4,5-DOPA-extradiol-dioxygenase [Ferruginibacter albus]|uniref:4,5-DOPA-extradiol-dioxygenase n=1 Tax=Ferruginibacter albus TaxID=2875540 RepID=UPI001CC79BE4|nr:4,5-DOPA dioxygenase extradiol [Ferruginibacter albus]UAY53592.1 4,5-DOPA dioxygenase extradiol [Ferruginibacter albus]